MTTNRLAWVFVGFFTLVLPGCGEDEPTESGIADDLAGADDSDGDDDVVDPGTGSAGAPAVDDDAPDDGGTVEDGANVPTAEQALVGEYCDGDNACAPGLQCLLESAPFFSDGSIPGGFCTASCDDDPEICESLDVGSGCLTFNNGTPEDESDDQAYCIDACSVGVSGNCNGIPDRYCQPLNPDEGNLGACLPRCYGDLSCPGAVCNGASGACAESQNPGGALGEPCTQAEDCSGAVCYLSDLEAGTGVCTEQCVIGPFRGACGEPADSTTPPEVVCAPTLETLVTEGAVADLDIGLCTATCDDDSDCSADGFACAVLGENFAASIGKQGLCLQEFALTDPNAGGAGAGGAATGGMGGTDTGGMGGMAAGGMAAGGMGGTAATD